MKMPQHFDSLHTLKVWSVSGAIMHQLYESCHREHFPYVHGKVFRYDHSIYSDAEIAESLMNYSRLRFDIHDGKSNTLTMMGHAVSATRVEETPSAFVVVIRGELSRQGSDCETVVVMYYDTSDGKGFCLIPEQARQILHCSN